MAHGQREVTGPDNGWTAWLSCRHMPSPAIRKPLSISMRRGTSLQTTPWLIQKLFAARPQFSIQFPSLTASNSQPKKKALKGPSLAPISMTIPHEEPQAHRLLFQCCKQISKPMTLSGRPRHLHRQSDRQIGNGPLATYCGAHHAALAGIGLRLPPPQRQVYQPEPVLHAWQRVVQCEPTGSGQAHKTLHRCVETKSLGFSIQHVDEEMVRTSREARDAQVYHPTLYAAVLQHWAEV